MNKNRSPGNILPFLTKKASIILVDWSVRDNYHSIYYWDKQTVPRDSYEIIWVEYYDKNPDEIKEYLVQGKLDKHIILKESGMFFKHRMYNEGLVISQGEIVIVVESDNIIRPTVLQTILNTFEEHKDENIVLYVDSSRTVINLFFPRRISLDDILRESYQRVPEPFGSLNGCKPDYGACFCAKRASIIEGGGFDEHPGYLSYWCGPYELGWRLVNKGYKEITQLKEWIVHSHHPGASREERVMWDTCRDPHKATITPGVRASGGYNILAIEGREGGRIEPLVMNERVKEQRI